MFIEFFVFFIVKFVGIGFDCSVIILEVVINGLSFMHLIVAFKSSMSIELTGRVDLK